MLECVDIIMDLEKSFQETQKHLSDIPPIQLKNRLILFVCLSMYSEIDANIPMKQFYSALNLGIKYITNGELKNNEEWPCKNWKSCTIKHLSKKTLGSFYIETSFR